MRASRHAALFAAVMRLAPLASAFAVSAVPAEVSAQAADAYKRHMDNGVKLFADRNYPAAMVEFEAAYAANPKASPLINVALCHKAQFKYPKAIETLETALTKHLDTMTEEDRKAALDAINEMRALLGHVKVTVTPAEAVLSVDGEKQSPEARKKPVPVAPGVHTFSASLSGYQTASQEVRVASGENKEVNLTLARAATPKGDAKITTPPDKPEAKRYSTALMVTGMVLGGVGVLSALSGVVVLSSKQAVCTDAQAAEDPPGGLCADDRRIGAGVVLTVLGGVGLAVGVPMFIVGIGPARKPTPAAQRAAGAEVLLGPTGGAMRWSF